jgi:hypothetical protein
MLVIRVIFPESRSAGPQPADPIANRNRPTIGLEAAAGNWDAL